MSVKVEKSHSADRVSILDKVTKGSAATPAAILTSIWVIYALIYLYGATHNYREASGYFVMVGEVAVDAAGIVILYVCGSQLKKKKSTYLLIMLLFIMAIIGDISFCMLHINPAETARIANEIAFFSFLLIADILLLKIIYADRFKVKETVLYTIPIATVSAAIGVCFIFGVNWKIGYTSILGMYQLFDTFLEVVGFVMAAFFMMVAGRLWVKMVSIGYLVLMASDLIIRTSTVLNLPPVMHVLEPAWTLGMMLVVRGVYLLSLEKNRAERLLELGGLRSYISVCVLSLCVASIVLFLIMVYILSGNESSQLHNKYGNLPPIIVAFTFLSVLISNKISQLLVNPINRLRGEISEINVGKKTLWSRNSRSKINEIAELERFVLQSMQLKEDKCRVERLMSEDIRRLAHDIRSPAFAIQTAIAKTPEINKRISSMLTQSIAMLDELALKILNLENSWNDVGGGGSSKSEFLSVIAKRLVDEKNAIYGDELDIQLSVGKSAIYLQTCLDSLMVERIMLNLINNSVDSVLEVSKLKRGAIDVSLKKARGCVELHIADNGQGIPAHVLPHVFKKGFTTKAKGSGIGLPFVKDEVEKIGGDVVIQSGRNGSTITTASFPALSKDDVFVEEIDLSFVDAVCVIDDDILFHEVCGSALSGRVSRVYHRYSYQEGRAFASQPDEKNILYFVDLNLSDGGGSGLDLIGEEGIANTSILVTGSCISEDLLARISNLHVKIIPKQCFNLVRM